jgi:uncharacterized coiled-coil protein SlyX
MENRVYQERITVLSEQLSKKEVLIEELQSLISPSTRPSSANVKIAAYREHLITAQRRKIDELEAQLAKKETEIAWLRGTLKFEEIKKIAAEVDE